MTLGLDELMIVNPGTPPSNAAPQGKRRGSRNGHRYFLGGDGTLYELRDQGAGGLGSINEAVGGFFLGDDGVLYQATPLV
jgi:hypothetical protein